MITVLEAARRSGKNAETIRRWIRTGRLRARTVGTRHMIDEADLEMLTAEPGRIERPAGWEYTMSGHPMPDSVALIREMRDSG